MEILDYKKEFNQIIKDYYLVCSKPNHCSIFCLCVENKIIHDVSMEMRDENGNRLATDDYYNKRLKEEWNILEEKRKLAVMNIDQIKEFLKERNLQKY